MKPKRRSMVSALEVLNIDERNHYPYRASDHARLADLNGVKSKGGFWTRNASRLEDIAISARIAYIKQMKQHHPDIGGSPERAQDIIDAYTFLKTQFKRKGIDI